MDTINTIKGGTAFLSLLKDEGVTHVFGNPGTTELPLMDALGKQSELPYILGLQESVVIGMADGFGRASGQLTSCNVHVAPGLGNAMGAIYNAAFTGTPIIITAGQQEQGHGLTEPVLYAPLVPIAAPLVKWAVEITRLEDMPRIVRRAAKVAMTPPTGPVFISLPGDVLLDEAGIELSSVTRIDTAVRPSDDAIDRMFQQDGHWAADAKPQAWSTPEQAFENENFWKVFDACMLSLPENVARVFSLRELMGLSTDDICKEVGIKENNAWVILHRARLKLRACIEKGWKEDAA